MTTHTPIERTGTGTRDWVPDLMELRPSQLGACPRYAWLEIRTPDDQKPTTPVGKAVMLYAGHAAEHEYLRLENEGGATWTTDVELDNGYGGICHPDALDFEKHIVCEIKFTGYRSPAAYHKAQVYWYVHRANLVFGPAWTWSPRIVLLDKYGAAPRIFDVANGGMDPLTPEMVAELTARAESMLGPTEPEGICNHRDDALNVKHYDIRSQAKKGQGMVCPMAGKCFPPNDDMEV